jgi:hypothetical protein
LRWPPGILEQGGIATALDELLMSERNEVDRPEGYELMFVELFKLTSESVKHGVARILHPMSDDDSALSYEVIGEKLNEDPK